MLRFGRSARIVVIAVCIAMLGGTVITVVDGRLTGLRLLAHAAVVFGPALAGVFWSLSPNARGRCATWVRALVGPPR